ncbi:Dyp-type peroxidase domain-containing protein, partial [Streptomyces sp. NPDC058272]
MTDTTEATEATPEVAGSPAPSRRSLIGWGGAGLALGAAVAGGAVAMTRTGDDVDPAAAESGAAVAFHGTHQAGIATAVQDRLHFAAFDVKTDDRAEFVQLLKDWTEAARRMTAGHAVGEGAYGGLAEAPPDDTGEALGLKPSRLTLTIGFGPSFFEKFGLRDQRPEALVDLPKFPGDNLEKARSDGD